MSDPLITPAIIGANCLIGLVAGPVGSRADWALVAGVRKVGRILRLGTPEQNHHIMRATQAAYVEAMRDMADACADIANDDESEAAARALSALTRKKEFKAFRYDGEHFPIDEANAAIDRMFAGGISSIDGGGNEQEHRFFGLSVVRDLCVWGVTLSDVQTRLFTDGIDDHPPWHLRFRIAFGEELIRDEAARSIFTQERLGEIRRSGIVLIEALSRLQGIVETGICQMTERLISIDTTFTQSMSSLSNGQDELRRHLIAIDDLQKENALLREEISKYKTILVGMEALVRSAGARS